MAASVSLPAFPADSGVMGARDGALATSSAPIASVALPLAIGITGRTLE